MSERTALVLGGGGPVGAAWTAALLHDLLAAGLPLAEADVVLGTSAGTVVGSWLTMQPDGLSTVPAMMRERAEWHARESASRPALDPVLRRQLASAFGQEDAESARAVGRAATAAMPPISVADAQLLWKPSLPAGAWPQRLGMTAVNAGTGEVRVWTARDDIPLAVGVSCSTAAPGAAPPVDVAGEVWLDGGVRSGTNADLIEGAPGRVLVVSPVRSERADREAAVLTERGHRVRVISATDFADAPGARLDPRFIDAAVSVGAGQAREVRSELTAWWH
jgi:NTE family protein